MRIRVERGQRNLEWYEVLRFITTKIDEKNFYTDYHHHTQRLRV